MDYCDVAWSSIGKIARDKLDRAQRMTAKIVFKATDSDAVKNLFKVASLEHEANA